MMPVYIYPLHGNQVPAAQQYHPGFEAVSPYMNFDPSKPPLSHVPCPYGNSFGYSWPGHACSGHGNFPAYYNVRPPCHHYSPPQCQCCGHHPPFHEPFPVQHVPTSHHPVEEPRYGYHNGVPGVFNNQCYGCPNLTHSPRSDERVKVEELDQDGQKNCGDSLIPRQLKNYPYPTVWFPPEYITNEELGKPLGSAMAGGKEKGARDMKPHTSLKKPEQEPKVWDGWFPLDMKSLGSLLDGEDGRKDQNDHNRENVGQFPIPFIWMPHDNKKDETDKGSAQMMEAPKSVEEMPSAVHFSPLKLNDSGDSKTKPFQVHEKAKDQTGLEVGNRKVDVKSIPVKQMETTEKESSEALKSKRPEGSMTGKVAAASTDKQPSSPPKASKLPPICLRVDPLPRKGNGNRRSRSLSPPGSNEQSPASKDTLKDCPAPDLKKNAHQDPHDQATGLSCKDIETKREERGVSDAQECESVKDKVELGGECQPQVPLTLPVGPRKEASPPETEEDGNICVLEGDSGSTSAGDKPNEGNCMVRQADEDPRTKPKRLSDAEAAVLIQSAYRGFEARKWEPLKKLKQIAEVREQLVEVRNKIQDLESSSDLQKDDRQRVIIGEMIMRLLLKLDAIQSLHPDIRDVRKTLARELVTLQDKLDSLMIRKSEQTVKEEPSEEPSVVLSKDTVVENEQMMDTREQSDKCSSQAMHVMPQTGDVGSSNPSSAAEEEHPKSEEDVREVPVANQSDAVVVKLEDEAGNSDSHPSEADVPEDQLATILCEPEETFQMPSLKSNSEDSEESKETLSEGTCYHPDIQPVAVSNSDSMNDGTGVEKEQEAPIGEHHIPPDEEEPIVMRATGVMPSVEVFETDTSSDFPSLPVFTDDTPPANNVETDILKELPIRVIDEEEPEVQEKAGMGMQGNGVLCRGDREHEVPVIAPSPVEVVSVLDESKPVEACENELFVAASDDSVNFACEKEEDRPGDAVDVEEVEEPLGLQGSSYKELMEVSVPEEMKQVLCQGREDVEVEESGMGSNVIGSLEIEVQTEDNMGHPKAGEETEERAQEERAHFESLTKEQLVGTPDPTPSRFENGDMDGESNKKLVEENEKLKEMMEKLLEAGKEQLAAISNLSGRVKDLEKKLSKQKKRRTRRSAASCGRTSHNSSRKDDIVAV